MSDAGIHDSTTIIVDHVRSYRFGHAGPVVGGEACPHALVGLACRVFQPRRRRTELVESRERGVEVDLFEDFAAADPIPVDRQQIDLAPLGVEAIV